MNLPRHWRYACNRPGLHSWRSTGFLLFRRCISFTSFTCSTHTVLVRKDGVVHVLSLCTGVGVFCRTDVEAYGSIQSYRIG